MNPENILSDSALIKLPEDSSALPPVSVFSLGEGGIEDFGALAETASLTTLGKNELSAFTGFGTYALDFSGKTLKISCGEGSEKAYGKIVSGEGLCLEPLMLEVPDGAVNTVILHFDSSRASMVFDLLRIKVGKGGKLDLYLLFEGKDTERSIDFGSELGGGAELKTCVLFKTGKGTIYRSFHGLKEEGASFRETAISVLSGREKADLRTDVVEEAGNVKASVESRTVLKGASRVGLKGVIKVKKEASRSASYYAAHCLKLSPSARADVEPDLEIEALDVTASHSASVSPIDEEKLFYLRSRGLTEELAKREISLGFLSSLIKEGFLLKAVEEIV